MPETKFDSSIPTAQFFIPRYSILYRLDRNANDGGILLYIIDDIVLTLIQREIQIEGHFVELNLMETNGSYAVLTTQRKALYSII